jgi:hypothetical protein
MNEVPLAQLLRRLRVLPNEWRALGLLEQYVKARDVTWFMWSMVWSASAFVAGYVVGRNP